MRLNIRKTWGALVVLGILAFTGCGQKTDPPEAFKVGEDKVSSSPLSEKEQHDTQFDLTQEELDKLLGTQEEAEDSGELEPSTPGTKPNIDIGIIDVTVIPGTNDQDPPEVVTSELVSPRLDRNPMGWSWNSLMDQHKAEGYANRNNLLITDIDLRSTSPLKFSVTMVQKKGKYNVPFWFYVNQSQAQVNNKLTLHNGRVLDLESYVNNGTRRYCIIIIPREDLDLTSKYQVHFEKSKSQIEQIVNDSSIRAIDLERYDTGGTVKYDLVTVPNSGIHQRASQLFFEKSELELKVAMASSSGKQISDIERSSGSKFSGILTTPLSSAPVRWYYGKRLSEIKSLYKHSDSRIIDLEPYNHNGELKYAMALVNNSPDVFHPLHQDAKDIVEQHIEDNNIVGVSVSIVKDGELAYQRGFGFSNKDKLYRVSPYHTRIRWASISKSITGTLATKMMGAGIVDKDVPASTYWPAYSTPDYWKDSTSDKAIVPTTLKLLLSNSAGIQHYNNGPNDMVPQKSLRNDPSDNTGIEWAVKRFKDGPLVKEQGVYSYSTFGFNLAGTILERGNKMVTGEDKSFFELVQEYVAGPLDMNTLEPHYYWEPVPYLTKGYKSGGKTEGDTSDVSYKLPGGGFISPSQDMGKLMKGLMSSYFTSADKALAWKKHSNVKYGFGMGVSCDNCSDITVSHSGSQPASNTLMVFYPKKKLGFALMSNTKHGSTNLWALHSKLKVLFED